MFFPNFDEFGAHILEAIMLDADVLAALRASGDGWQKRINDALRASLQLAGKLG
jgi:uncharacterized protein (DUF4415 family)